MPAPTQSNTSFEWAWPETCLPAQSRGADPSIKTEDYDPYLNPGCKTPLEASKDCVTLGPLHPWSPSIPAIVQAIPNHAHLPRPKATAWTRMVAE